jgi:hypothetical protein
LRRFSGGDTRAAAVSRGVFEVLRDGEISIHGEGGVSRRTMKERVGE